MTLEIIGPGFGRTGTSSLKAALELLGFGPCHHMFEVRDNPERLADWQALARGEPADWDAVFRGYRAQLDWPGARYWRELVRHYPRARVILTVRDPDAWFDSIQATIAPLIAARGTHGVPLVDAIAELGQRIVVEETFAGNLSDRDHAVGTFRDHVDAVQREVAPDRLLTYDLHEGWEPLCRFLGVPVPATPLPWLNSSSRFHEAVWQDAERPGA